MAMMTLAEAAKLLGVSPTTLRNQVYNAKLTAIKVGRDYLVTPEEVERYRVESLGLFNNKATMRRPTPGVRLTGWAGPGTPKVQP